MIECSINASLLIFLAIAVCLVIYLIFKIHKASVKNIIDRMNASEGNIRQEILSSVQTKFLDVSLNTKDLIELSVEVWRLECKYSPILDTMDENAKRGIENTLSKIKRYLDKNDFEVIDFTNQKFSDGLNVEILSIEEDESTDPPVIKETVEPTVMCRGQLVKKAKVILLKKESKGN